MSEYPLFLIKSETEVIETVAVQLENMLMEYYNKFKYTLVTGLIVVIIGVGALLMNPRGGWLVFSLLTTLIGLTLIYVAFARKVRIKELNVALYPVLVVPYGDGTHSLVVDLLNLSGDIVEFKFPRVDQLGSKLNYHLEMLKIHSSYLYELEEQEVHIEGIPLRNGQMVSTFYPESRVIDEICEILNTLNRRTYDTFSFRLFKSGNTISAYPPKLIGRELLLTENLGKSIKETKSKIHSLLETLKIEYSDLLYEVVTAVEKAKKELIEHYNNLAGKIELTFRLMERAMEQPKARVCPHCYTTHTKDILSSSTYPLVNIEGKDEKGNLIYWCRKCNYRYVEPLEPTESARMPIKLYWLDILQSKTWSNLYVSRIDEINKYISEARRVKSEKYYEALRQINELIHQFKSNLMPIYMELSKVLNEIQANNSVISYANSVVPKENKLCVRFDLSQDVLDSYEKSRRFLSRDDTSDEITKTLLIELNEAKKLRINSIYLNEVALKGLIKAYEQIGKLEDSENLRKILEERDYDELEKYLR